MGTARTVGVTALATAALAAPAAIALHDYVHPSGQTSATSPQTRGSGNSQGSGSNNAPSDNSANPAMPNDGAAVSASGTSTRATNEQAKGVVMIDTALNGGEGAGSGMVLTSSGTVLTNYHVVAGSTQIRVTTSNGQRYTAKVVGHDQRHDIAVLKLEGASGLATVSIDQDGVKKAEQVLAVGQGEGQGVLYAARGVVTDLNRQITAQDQDSLATSEALTGLIQVNAPIVPGYSGGPLFDKDGKVVGVDTAASATNSLTSYTSKASSAGFAIPISSAMSVANSIISGQKTATNHLGAKAALGIGVVPTSSTGSGDFGGNGGNGQDPHGNSGGASSVQGVQVQSVLNGTGADAAGLERGDVITSVAGHTINSSTDLSHAMDSQYPGQKVKVSWTDPEGQSHSATISLMTSTTN